MMPSVRFSLMPIGLGVLGILLTGDGIKKVKVALGGKSRKKRALASLGKPRQEAAPLTELNKTARTIYRWMFSWAQPS
jgi:hypothetical protein